MAIMVGPDEEKSAIEADAASAEGRPSKPRMHAKIFEAKTRGP